MAIKVKTLAAPKLNILERLYIPEVLKGLKTTIMHILRFKPVTVQYPEEKKKLSPRYRGLHILPVDDEGKIRCVACKLCEIACPTQAISIVSEPADEYGVERRPKVYNIDFIRCVFCGFCVEACPCDALRMGLKYELGAYNRAGLIHTKEVFIDPSVKSIAPRDNANFLWERAKGFTLDKIEPQVKSKETATVQ